MKLAVLLLLPAVVAKPRDLKGNKGSKGSKTIKIYNDYNATVVPAAFLPDGSLNTGGVLGYTGEGWFAKGIAYKDAAYTVKTGTYDSACFRTNDVEAYWCNAQHTFDDYPNSYLNLAGNYPDDATGGIYVITGGSGGLEGVTGLSTTAYDPSTSSTVQTFQIAI